MFSITTESILEGAISELKRPNAGPIEIANALFRLELLRNEIRRLSATADKAAQETNA